MMSSWRSQQRCIAPTAAAYCFHQALILVFYVKHAQVRRAAGPVPVARGGNDLAVLADRESRRGDLLTAAWSSPAWDYGTCPAVITLDC